MSKKNSHHKQSKPSFKHHPKDLCLDYYHCTFFLPLIGIEKMGFEVGIKPFYYSAKKNPTLADEEAQAYRYFSPALRNILFDCKKNSKPLEAVKEWRLDENTIKSWQLHLGKRTDQHNPIKYQQSKIVSVCLYQYFNGIYLLAVRVEPIALIELRKQNVFENNAYNTITELVKNDPKNKVDYKQLAMENWLHFTRHVRLLYPSFPQQNDENKIAPIHLLRENKDTITAFEKEINKIQIHEKPGADFSPVIGELLKAFAKEPANVSTLLENYKDFYDDRMFVSVAYGIAGDKLPAESLKRINTLVSHVDRQDAEGHDCMKGYAYTPQVILEKTRNNALSLWEGLGGYYTFTDFSNTYLSTGCSFRSYIAAEHIPHIYDRMLIQTLFYQASLRYYDNQICDQTYELLKTGNLKAIRKQREEFVRFTNQYWFHSLTTQMQGKEIFNLQQKALGLQEHYSILKDELERTDEYLQTAHEIKISEMTDKLTRYGVILALIAIYYTALPIISDAIKTDTTSLWTKVSSWIPCTTLGQKYNTETGLFLLLFICPVVVWGAYKIFDKIKKLM